MEEYTDTTMEEYTDTPKEEYTDTPKEEYTDTTMEEYTDTNQEGTLISENPFQIIQYDKNKEKFSITEEAKILKKIEKPMKVICIIGAYRTGKSLLMNKILRVQKGFELGHTVNGKTRGIWCWGKEMDGFTLLVLDTEGLFDVSGDRNLDARFFVLSLLFSSYLIYNILSTIKDTDISNLELVLELTDYISTKRIEENTGEDLKLHLPSLMFLIRDFSLSLPEGQNSNDYLVECLQSKSGSSRRIILENTVRQQIRTIFPSITCFTLPTPVNDMEKQLKLIEENPNVLRPEFTLKLDGLINFLYQNTEIKKLGTIQLNGLTFLQVIQNYLDAFNSGKSPMIPDAIESVREIYLNQIKDKVNSFYDSELNKISLEFPVSEEKLLEVHKKCLENCSSTLIREMFGFDIKEKKKIVNDFIYSFEQLEKDSTIVGGKIYFFLEKNRKMSHEKCIQIWESLINPLQKEMLNKSLNMEECRKRFRIVEISYFRKAIGPAVFSAHEECKQKFEIDLLNFASELKISEFEKERIKKEHESEIEQARTAEMNLQTERKLKEAKKQLAQHEKIVQEMKEARRKEKEDLRIELERRHKEHERQLEELKRIHEDYTAELVSVNEKALERAQKIEQERINEMERIWRQKEKEKKKKLKKELNLLKQQQNALQKDIQEKIDNRYGLFNFLSDIARVIPGENGEIISNALKKFS